MLGSLGWAISWVLGFLLLCLLLRCVPELLSLPLWGLNHRQVFASLSHPRFRLISIHVWELVPLGIVIEGEARAPNSMSHLS